MKHAHKLSKSEVELKSEKNQGKAEGIQENRYFITFLIVQFCFYEDCVHCSYIDECFLYCTQHSCLFSIHAHFDTLHFSYIFSKTKRPIRCCPLQGCTWVGRRFDYHLPKVHNIGKDSEKYLLVVHKNGNI